MSIILHGLYFAHKTRSNYLVYLLAGVVMDGLMLATYAIQSLGR